MTGRDEPIDLGAGTQRCPSCGRRAPVVYLHVNGAPAAGRCGHCDIHMIPERVAAGGDPFAQPSTPVIVSEEVLERARQNPSSIGHAAAGGDPDA